MKIDFGKLKAAGAIVASIYAAIAAFSEARERQLQSKAIEELESKVAKLEEERGS